MHGAPHQTSRKPYFTNKRPVSTAAPGSVAGRGLAVAREACTAACKQSAQHQCRSPTRTHVSINGKHHQLHQSRVLLPGGWQRRFCLSHCVPIDVEDCSSLVRTVSMLQGHHGEGLSARAVPQGGVPWRDLHTDSQLWGAGAGSTGDRLWRHTAGGECGRLVSGHTQLLQG